jgi:ABC-type metal ion transport system substrate-binding protein
LSHVSVSPGSGVTIATDVTNVERQLAALKNQGTGQFSAQANQLTAAVNTITKDGQALDKSPTPTNFAKLTNAVNSFKTTAQPIIKEMQTICP